MQVRQKELYWFVLILSCATVTVAVGGGLFSQSGPREIQWQYQAFQQLCHQLPSRSFWINGQPMAVCSRCLGIYTAFTLFWILMPVISYQWDTNIKGSTTLLVTAIVLNAVDVAGNFMGFWENTLFSRFFFGAAIGSTVVILLVGYFINNLNQEKKYRHGYTKAVE